MDRVILFPVDDLISTLHFSKWSTEYLELCPFMDVLREVKLLLTVEFLSIEWIYASYANNSMRDQIHCVALCLLTFYIQTIRNPHTFSSVCDLYDEWICIQTKHYGKKCSFFFISINKTLFGQMS